MVIIGADGGIVRLKDNSRYDFKTIKLRPGTYGRLVKLKAAVEQERLSLYSFDRLVLMMIDLVEKR